MEVRCWWQGEALSSSSSSSTGSSSTSSSRVYNCATGRWGGGRKQAVTAEFTLLRKAGLPKAHVDLCKALAERSEQEDGTLQLQQAENRRLFWLMHMSSKFPWLLSAHVTSCAPERNWSMFGNIFSKTKNRLALERAKKIAYIRGNSSGSMGADQEILLSEIDVMNE